MFSPVTRQHGSTTLVEAAAGTTVGKRRVDNEDRFGLFLDEHAFVVADGCGGRSSGESAANLTIECFRKIVGERALVRAEPLAVAMLLANAEVFRAGQTNPKFRGAGTAVCAMRISDGQLVVAHVGDCRLGRFRKNELAWLTEDHTLLAELRRSGTHADMIAEVEREHRNVILRAVGTSEHVSVDVAYHPVTSEDLYVLASDGLWGQVVRDHIIKLLRESSKNLTGCVDALLEASNDAGGADNATVVLVRMR